MKKNIKMPPINNAQEEDDKKDENKGKFQLGGCCISNDDPAFSCNDCGNLFGIREEEEDD